MNDSLLRTFTAVLPLVALSTGCDPDGPSEEAQTDCAQAKCDDVDPDGDARFEGVCVGLRGNGPRIWAHFGALARIVEDVGPIGATIGGSSGSISAFLAESIMMNPAFECDDRPCTEEDARRERDQIALLFKSVEGYAEFLKNRPEAMVFQDAAAIVRSAREARFTDLAQLDLAALADDPQAATVELERAARLVANLRSLLEQGAVSKTASFALDLLDDEVEALVLAPLPTDPAEVLVRLRRLRDIADATANFGSFTAEDPTLLVRSGVVDFEALTERLGVIANFYAGVGFEPSDFEADNDPRSFGRFLEDCAEGTRGMPWAGGVAEHAPFGESCQARLDGLIEQHWALHDFRNDAGNRIDDRVGEHLPTVISTSVMTGRTVEVWKAAMAHHRDVGDHAYAWPLPGDDPDPLSFEDTRFGYWGPDALVDAIVADPEGLDDLKTRKAMALGHVTWREALSFSPAEPGLSRAREMDGTSWEDATRVSAGGWSDLFPVQAMRNMGCEQSIFVTTVAKVHGFQNGLARMLGMTDDEKAALYEPDLPQSSFGQALSLAHDEGHALLCTRWDDPSNVLEFPTLSAAGYEAPLSSFAPERFPEADALTPEALLDRYERTVSPEAKEGQGVARGCLPPG